MTIDEMAIKNIAGMIERKSFDFAYGWLQAMRVHSGLSADVGQQLQADLEAAHRAHVSGENNG